MGSNLKQLSLTMSDPIHELAKDLAERIKKMPLAERVDALNYIRSVLHEASPFRDEPVDLVLWVANETVRGNEYNPNTVAPVEMKLLRHSIEADGYTQPVVTYRVDDKDEVVDGFHRHRVGKETKSVRERVRGYLPVARIKADRADKKDRIAATIRHNRARGRHGVQPMSAIVAELHQAGWADEQIAAELGMEADEVLRLKQVTGLAALFKDREYSEAWEPERKQRGKRQLFVGQPGEKMPPKDL